MKTEHWLLKTEHWLLLGVGAYLLFSRSGIASALGPGPGGISTSPVSGRNASGTMPPGGGGGGSSNLNPAAASLTASRTGQPTLATDGFYYCADGTQVNDMSLCPVNESNYITCPDGTMVNDPSLCGPNAEITCWDGSVVSDPSLCPDPTAGPTGFTDTGYVDTGDPCDPNSSAYDPSQCGSGL